MPREDRANINPPGTGAFLNLPYQIFTPNTPYLPPTPPMRPATMPGYVRQNDVNQAFEAMAVSPDTSAGSGLNRSPEVNLRNDLTRSEPVGGYRMNQHGHRLIDENPQNIDANRALDDAEQDALDAARNIYGPFDPPVSDDPVFQNESGSGRSRGRTQGDRSTRTSRTPPPSSGLPNTITYTGHLGGIAMGRDSAGNLHRMPDTPYHPSMSRGPASAMGGYRSAGMEHSAVHKHRERGDTYVAKKSKWKSKDGKHVIMKVAPQLLPHLQEYFGGTGMIEDYDGDGIPNELDPTPNG